MIILKVIHIIMKKEKFSGLLIEAITGLYVITNEIKKSYVLNYGLVSKDYKKKVTGHYSKCNIVN